MNAAQPLYDFAPLAELMLLGLAIALGPLAWVAWRNRHGSPVRRWQALAILTLFLTFDLVLFGAFTRLTDSGLGCPDWPGCYGNASPVGARAAISAAQEAMPTGPVTHRKAWVEMVHRYLASAVGVLIIALTAGAWWQWRDSRRAGPDAAQERMAVHPWWPTATLVWVCLQGAFGAWTVTMKLFPAIVTLHLVGGIVLLALLCVQAVRQTQASRGIATALLAPGLRALLVLAAALVGLQILLGGWVSTNYAVLACSSFPTCQGSWWPDMAFAEGFQIWRPLGLLQDGSHISFAGLTAIHYAHRLAAYAVLAALALLAWRLRGVPALRPQARWLAGLALLQFATGLSNVVLDWPLVAAVLHTGGAAALVVALTWTLAASRAVGARDKMSTPRAVETAAGAQRISSP
ncbi:COX15/CtaA family protein [Paracidovorax cattleyae]|uniref:Cytochrome c oxidase assembly protein subunit 15 n=1 Tax=Paracidovorax cattleyae TaxID=80868 RepID=A0A1H0T807_9BURK|nr:COX15/CtaA family protein [Paracidovorax cattleyae]AVS75466.1 heme A synthase [Paracidovorax cattleyae]SDP50144.1 cytochrome c oxidase assembly protein subunit 15 [Paracidovorax cattleyae]